MRRTLVFVLALVLASISSPPTGLAQGDTRALVPDDAVERALALALARPSDGPFVTRLVREARASAAGIDGLRERLAALRADPAKAFAAAAVAGHVARATRDFVRAREAYRAAIELRPDASIPHLGLARLARDSGDLPAAVVEYDAAFERLPEGDERRGVASERGLVALTMRDFDAAEHWFGIATRGRPRYERAALARAYADAGEHGRAVAVLETLASESRGDPREEAPALRDLGLGLVQAGRFDDATSTLERARRVARGDSGLELEIDDAIIEAHRRAGRLDAYVDALVARHPRDATSIARVATLSEELGRDEAALAAFEQLVTLSRTDPEPRSRVVRILIRLGRVDDALRAESALVDIAPRAPRFFVPAIERLASFGRMEEALTLFDRVAARVGDDVASHAALADLAERLGDEARLGRELEALVRLEPGEPSHRIALATERISTGSREEALAMLDAALHEASSDPDDLATVAMALADRGYPRPAEEALRAALSRYPDSLGLLRAYADVLDPNGDRPGRRPDGGRERDAVATYERVLRHPDADAPARRDARRRILAIERRAGRIDERSRQWDRELTAGGESAGEAGHFLLELRQGQRPFDAAGVERVASRLVALFPRDAEAYLALERARTVVGDHVGAIAALERLVDLDPTRLDGYVDRLVEHAEAAYLDEDALRFAMLGVERAPTDPRAEARLGDLLRRRRDSAGAMAAYRRALAIDDRRTDVWLSVAGIGIADADVPLAVNAYDRVLRLSTDDDSVGRAAESAATALSTMGRDDAVVELLLPHVASRPRVLALHRALFVALERRVRALERAGDMEALHSLGRRGVPVLLESLADRDGERAARAARLLGRLDATSAFDALLGCASRHPAEIARRAAIESAARLATLERAPAFVRLLDAPERRTRLSAALVLVSFSPTESVRTTLIAHSEPWVRAAGLLAYELAGERVDEARLGRSLADERDPAVRALALLAAHRHGTRFLAKLEASASRLDVVGRAARVALGRIDAPEARLALARCVASDNELVAEDSIHAHLGRALGWPPNASFATARDLEVAVRMLLDAASTTPTTPAMPDARFLDAVDQVFAAGDPGDVAVELVALARLDASSAPGAWPRSDALRARLSAAIGDSRAGTRVAALRMFPRAFGPADASLLDRALRDGDREVVRAAIDAISPAIAPEVGRTIADLAIHHTDFDIRCAAASLAAVARRDDVIEALEQALLHDPIAFVREAAARSLVTIDRSSRALETARTSDPEPRVRDAARIPGPTTIRVVDQMARTRLPMRSRSGPLGDRSSDG